MGVQFALPTSTPAGLVSSQPTAWFSTPSGGITYAPVFASTSLLDRIGNAAIAGALSFNNVVQAWRAGNTQIAAAQPQATSATSFITSSSGLILLVLGVVVLAVILGRR